MVTYFMAIFTPTREVIIVGDQTWNALITQNNQSIVMDHLYHSPQQHAVRDAQYLENPHY